jgi:hypothetical protein
VPPHCNDYYTSFEGGSQPQNVKKQVFLNKKREKSIKKFKKPLYFVVQRW